MIPENFKCVKKSDDVPTLLQALQWFPIPLYRIYWLCTQAPPYTPFSITLPAGPLLPSYTGLPETPVSLCAVLPQGSCTRCSRCLFHSVQIYRGLSHFIQDLARITILSGPFLLYEHNPRPHTLAPSLFYFFPRRLSPSEATGARTPPPGGATPASWGPPLFPPRPAPCSPRRVRRLTRLRSWAACSL